MQSRHESPFIGTRQRIIANHCPELPPLILEHAGTSFFNRRHRGPGRRSRVLPQGTRATKATPRTGGRPPGDIFDGRNLHRHRAAHCRTMHQPAPRHVVILDRAVLHRAVVPHQHVAGAPLVAIDERRLDDVLRQRGDQRFGFPPRPCPRSPCNRRASRRGTCGPCKDACERSDDAPADCASISVGVGGNARLRPVKSNTAWRPSIRCRIASGKPPTPPGRWRIPCRPMAGRATSGLPARRAWCRAAGGRCSTCRCASSRRRGARRSDARLR